MAVQQHAIAPGARRAGFWPSIAVAAAQLRRQQLSQIGQGQPGDPAVVPRLPSPDGTARRSPERCAMRVSGRRLSRLELGFIAAALLLPVPLVALNGYAAALPAAVERGLGSLVTLEARDDRSGLKASGQASEDGSNAQRSAARVAQDHSSWGDVLHRRQARSRARPARARRHPARATTAAARHPTTNPRTRPATPEARARPAKAAAPPATAKEGRLPLPATLRACP